MESDPPEIGGEGIFLINELSRAYVKVDTPFCNSILPSFQERAKYPYSRYNNPGTSAAILFRCTAFKSVNPDEPEDMAAVANHVRAGFNLSDLYCDTFFRRIAKHANQRRFARNATNDVGTAVSTALALAAASTGVTGGAAAAFGLMDSSFRNYDDSFLVSTDLHILQPKVFDEQGKFKAIVYANMPTNYFDANMAVIRYANFCSYVGMKALLNEAVVRSTNVGAASSIQNYRVATETNEEALEVALLTRRAELAEQRKAAEERLAAVEAGDEEEEGEEAGTDEGE
jgi:hypothetical protein